MVEAVLERTGYEEMLNNERSIEAQSRLENLEEFKTVTQEFEKANEDKTLIAFLTDLALIADIDRVDEEDPDHSQKNYHDDTACSKRIRISCCFLNWDGRECISA